MRVLPPIEITDAILTSSSIPEPDIGETVWVAGTYNTGDQRINTTTHKVYEVVATPSTSDDPLVGVDATPPTWVEVGSTNRYAMFDSVIGTTSTDNTALTVQLDTGALTNAMAGFNITGASSINITMTDTSAGVVYDKDISMVDNDAVVDYYGYFFEPIINIKSFVVWDMPAYNSATLDVTINGTGDISVGTLATGARVNLGVTNKGTSLKLLDFNVKERDAFGNFIVTTDRRTAKLVDYDVTIQTSKIGYVYSTLSSLTTTAAIWAGTGRESESTLVYGYYRNMNINIEADTISSATIQIEGLI